MTRTILCALATLGLTAPAWSATVFLPGGMIVYGQLGQEVTSSTRKFPVGFQPLGHVWRDVEVDGVTIIEAGTPVSLRVSRISPRGVGGRGAQIEITAMYTTVVGGEEVNLRGGYGQATPDSGGLNRALSTAGALSGVPFMSLPMAFIPGRKAVLEEGMVFDMEIPADTYIEIPDEFVPTLNLRAPTGLTVSIVYDELRADSEVLPLALRLCGGSWTDEISIESVNDKSVKSIPVATVSQRYEDECFTARNTVDLETLSAHFEHGINRFTVTIGEVTEEVMINVEM